MSVLSSIAAGLAVFAAMLWFLSAIVKTPDSYSVHVVRPREAPLGGFIWLRVDESLPLPQSFCFSSASPSTWRLLARSRSESLPERNVCP